MPRIILIDDDDSFLSVLTEALRPHRTIVVDTASTAEQGLRLIANVDYDVIISDFLMPGLNGIDLLKECKALRPNTPIVLLTGYGSAPLKEDAFRLGVYGILEKPVDADVFYVTVQSASRRHDLLRRAGWMSLNPAKAQGEFLSRQSERIRSKIKEINERLEGPLESGKDDTVEK